MQLAFDSSCPQFCTCATASRGEAVQHNTLLIHIPRDKRVYAARKTNSWCKWFLLTTNVYSLDEPFPSTLCLVIMLTLHCINIRNLSAQQKDTNFQGSGVSFFPGYQQSHQWLSGKIRWTSTDFWTSSQDLIRDANPTWIQYSAPFALSQYTKRPIPLAYFCSSWTNLLSLPHV